MEEDWKARKIIQSTRDLLSFVSRDLGGGEVGMEVEGVCKQILAFRFLEEKLVESTFKLY